MCARDEAGTATEVALPEATLQPGNLPVRANQKPESSSRPVSHPHDIPALTRAVRGGDAEAFATFYDLYHFRVYKYLLALTRGDEAQAKEITQAVFIKVAKGCKVFGEEGGLWTWMGTVARNAFIDHCRARRREGRFVDLECASAELDGFTTAEHRLGAVFHEVLSTLPSADRELMQAAYIDNRPLKELAEEAGQTYKALESRLGRLRRLLKQRVLTVLRHENES